MSCLSLQSSNARAPSQPAPMKQVSITIHPFSALVGMAVLSMAWVTAGAMPLQGSSSNRDVSAIENVNDPHPRDFVLLTGSSPYIVPEGKILVVEALGDRSNPMGDITLTVDGEIQVARQGYGGGGSGIVLSILELPGRGIAVGAGAVVEVAGGGTESRAWGYLVDA